MKINFKSDQIKRQISLGKSNFLCIQDSRKRDELVIGFEK